MSTTIVKLNSQTDLRIIKHEQFKEYLAANFAFSEESAQILDEIVIKLAQAEHDVARLTRKKEEYEAKPLCSGTAHWPDDNPGYMKCNHGTGDTCPMHGKHHNPRSRLRIGIGRDSREITKVETAIEDYRQYQAVLGWWEKFRKDLAYLQRQLKQAIGIYR